MKAKKRTSLIGLTAMFGLLVGTVFGADAQFTSYTSSSNGIYSYSKAPLGCNYTESVKRSLVGNGNKWKMNTVIKNTKLNNGALEIDGVTTLSNENTVYGFTGGTFVVAKDSAGYPLCIVSAKTNMIIDSTEATNGVAEVYGWGTDPGKIKFYKWKPYVSANVIDRSWHVTIPAYIMQLNPSIEIIQSHTPSNRALRGLGEFLKYALSFAIANGASITDLVNKANNNTLTFADFVNFTNNSIEWAKTQKLVTSVQAEAAKNIVNAIDGMQKDGIIGLEPKNYASLVNMALAIQMSVNDKSLSFEETKMILNSLEDLMQDQSAFVPSSMTYIETIVTNLKVLSSDKLTAQQNAAFDKVIAIIRAINTLPQAPVYRHMDIVFDAITAGIELAESGTITADSAKAKIDPLMNKIGGAIASEYGVSSKEMLHYLAMKEIIDNLFVIINNGQTGWTSENLTTAIDAFTILAGSISGKEISIETLMQFNQGIMSIVNNNGGWSFQNAEALANLIDGLQGFVQHPLITQLKNELVKLQK